MGKGPLKIVVWCGSAPNHKALANKIAARFQVAGIVVDTGSPAKKKQKPDLITVLIDRIRFRKIYKAWQKLLQHYRGKYPGWPETEIIKVPGINCNETVIFTNNLQPDLIVVSGTALIKEPLLNVPATVGIINLHTGLSPYVKGGPNCTNWCIANNTFELVGNTVMWLNAGIDSGNIITSETIDICQAHDLETAHRIVMEHAHDLYLRTIEYLSASDPPFNSVSQNSLGKGNLYLTKMWTSAKRRNLLKNWKNRRKTFNKDKAPKIIELKF